MATSTEYAEFICRQLQGVGELRTRKMFGEYCIYVNDKPLILCCDNIPYIKKDEAIADLMTDAECGYPYPGAREHYILDADHASEARRIIHRLESVTPLPKPKKRKKPNRNPMKEAKSGANPMKEAKPNLNPMKEAKSGANPMKEK